LLNYSGQFYIRIRGASAFPGIEKHLIILTKKKRKKKKKKKRRRKKEKRKKKKEGRKGSSDRWSDDILNYANNSLLGGALITT